MKRRTFVRAASTVAAFSVVKPGVAFGSRANSTIQMGIIGCGNRGMSVISSMSRHTPVRIAAMADLYPDQLEAARPVLNQLNADKGMAPVPNNRVFAGPDAFRKLIEVGNLDAVLISSPAYTHPDFTREAALAGKHIYCEKPVAVDAAGARKMIQTGQMIDGRQSLVIGFQIRHASPYVEMIRRIQRGDIGRIINVQLYYLSSGAALRNYPEAGWEEQQIRNHYKFRHLSGGILLDQGIHMLDVCNWALAQKPVAAIGWGGREGAPDFGDAYTNFQVIYDYPNDIRVSLHSTQFGPHFGDVAARFIGTNGIAEAHYTRGVYIDGPNAWDSGMIRDNRQPVTAEQRASGVFPSALHDADTNKQKAFIHSIESGQYLNEARSGAESTLSAILGREAATEGKICRWDEIWVG